MNQFAYAGSANQNVHAVKIRGGDPVYLLGWVFILKRPKSTPS